MRHLAATCVLAGLACPGVCGPRKLPATQPARPSPRDFPAAKDLPARAEDPDPLVMLDGTPVRTKEDWLRRRRPELAKLVQHYMFGYSPPEWLAKGTPAPTVVAEDANALGGLAAWRHLRVPLAPDPNVCKDLHLLIPNAGDGPFPVILTFGAPGAPRPQDLPASDWKDMPKDACEPPPTQPAAGETSAEYRARVNKARDRLYAQKSLHDAAAAMRRGYAIASFRHNQSSDNIYTKGIYPHYQPVTDGPLIEHPFGARHLLDWGEIAAWSWCARRMLDVIEKEKRLDDKRVAIMGGSRTGCAAMLTAAIDERFAAVIAWQISPFRWRQGKGPMGGAWGHWVGTAYSQFDDCRDRMPVEYTCLAAAVAPRPMLITASPTASFATPDPTAWIANGAAKAYRFLGCDVEDFKGPWAEPGLRGKGPLRMHLRAGGHGYHADDWPAYLDFLDAQFKPRAKEKTR